jgi:hypothetical protein
MRRKATVRSSAAFVSVAVVAVAGCGGGTKTVTTQPLPPGVSRTPEEPKPINASYSVALSGKPATGFGIRPSFRRGAPNASALAVVTTNASTLELCWKFSQLKNVSSPTVARLFRNFPGATGRSGFLLGRRYRPSGCIHLEPGSLGVIGAKPQQFFLNIHTTRYPLGAVRGPLRYPQPSPSTEGTEGQPGGQPIP